jgi:hypothetical protein
VIVVVELFSRSARAVVTVTLHLMTHESERPDAAAAELMPAAETLRIVIRISDRHIEGIYLHWQ